jgi:predicted alpha-1,6-mannanase (GH76 family)
LSEAAVEGATIPQGVVDSSSRADATSGGIDAAAGSDANLEASPGPSRAGCDAPAAHTHADQALDGLSTVLDSRNDYFNATAPADGQSTEYWTFAEAWEAVMDGAERTGSARYLAEVPSLYAAQNARGWSSFCYDDEAWMTLALIHAYEVPGTQAYLDHAGTLFQDLMGGWDSTSAHPGGIWWNRRRTQKATASNGGPVIAGVFLSAKTGNAAQLTFARKVYDFWYATMVDPRRTSLPTTSTPTAPSHGEV